MKWISIKKELPETSKHVLISDGKNITQGYFTRSTDFGNYWVVFEPKINKSFITHWCKITLPK